MVDKRTPHVYVEFEAKFGELWATRTLRETWWTREQFTFMWNLRQNLESSGHQEKYKSHTSVGRKFAPVEGLSHDLVCTGSIYHVHFAWQVWHGQLSPRFKFNKIKSFSGVEIDQNHVDKRILGLKRHNFCPASVSAKITLLQIYKKKLSYISKNFQSFQYRGNFLHVNSRFFFSDPSFQTNRLRLILLLGLLRDSKKPGRTFLWTWRGFFGILGFAVALGSSDHFGLL